MTHVRPKESSIKHPSVMNLTLRLLSTIILFILLGVWGWQWLQDPNNSPIKLVQIHASYNHISREKLQEHIQPHVMSGFFASNAAELQQRLVSMPWTKSVSVQRIWPDTLLVRLIERDPVARWGSHGLIDQDSELFYPDLDSIPRDLPKLSGPTVMAPQILATFYKMQQILDKHDLKISEISVSPRRSWSIFLSNGILVELGRNEQMLRLERLMKVWPELMAKQHQKLSRIDLRYPNGMAVR